MISALALLLGEIRYVLVQTSSVWSFYPFRLCQEVYYIPDVAADPKKINSDEQKSLEYSMKTIIEKGTTLKQARECGIKSMKSMKDSSIEHINKQVNTIKKHLDEVKSKVITEIDGKFKYFEKAVMSDMQKSEEFIGNLTHMRNVALCNESDVFISVKQGKIVIEESRKLLQEVEMSDAAYASQSFEAAVENIVQACSSHLEAFESVKAFERFKAIESLYSEQRLKVKHRNDRSRCNIFGCCFLSNGKMVLADADNTCLKLLDTSYNFIDKCSLPDVPYAVCSVGDQEVAILLFLNQYVQFATVDRKICLTRSFPLRENCRGIAYANRKLYVSVGGRTSDGEGPGKVEVYSLSGDLLQIIKPNSPAQHTFSIPSCIIKSMKGHCIVANKRKGVIAFDENGDVAWQFQSSDLKQVAGLCEVDDKVLAICDVTGNILEVKQADRKSRLLLQGSEELQSCNCLAYDKINDKVVAMIAGSNYALVFKVQKM